MRGGERQTKLLISGLNERGWENYLVCKADSHLAGESGLPRQKIFPLKSTGELNLFSGLCIANFADRIGATILHCHTAHDLSLGIMGKCFSRAKLVATRRVDFPLKGGKFSVWKYRSADHIIAISRRIEDILLNSGVSREKVSLAPSGVILKDHPEIRPRNEMLTELNLPSDALIIGTIAALVGHKDYPTLLKAFKIVTEKYPLAYLTCLGEGNDRPQIERLTRELGLAGKVRLLGFRPDSEDFWGIFDIYVQASKLEGLCSSLIEAMYHRLPIAATSAGGIPDLVEDGVTGLLSPPENSQALADSILKLLGSPELRRELGAKAKDKSLHFSAEYMVQRTENIYKMLLNIE
jgi:glycosyltransferase involved in cell wall biosynthesis